MPESTLATDRSDPQIALDRSDPELGAELQTENNLLNLLRRASDDFRKRVLAELGNTDIGGMKKSHKLLLINLDLGGVRITELAKRTALTKQTVGTRVRQMTALGIVVLDEDPSDGRAKLVTPTSRGAQYLQESVETVRQITDEYVSVIGQRRMTQLHSTLRMLLNRIET